MAGFPENQLYELRLYYPVEIKFILFYSILYAHISECSTINLLLHKLNAETPLLTVLGCGTFPCECEKQFVICATLSMSTSSIGVSLAVFEYGYTVKF